MSNMMILWLMVLSIVPVVLGVGIFVVVRLRRSKAAKQLAAFEGDSFVVVTKLQFGSPDYADNVYIQSVNGQPAERVIYAMGIFGYYLPAGTHELIVDVDYGEGRHTLVTREGLRMTVTVERGKNYSLCYHIPTDRLVFEVYENARIFKEEKSGVFL